MGIMGEVADTVLAKGGEVIGIITRLLVRLLVDLEVAHKLVADLRVGFNA